MPSWQHERARVAINTRHHGPEAAETLAAKRDLRAARLEKAIRATVDAAPPLTGEQCTRLAALLSDPTARSSR
jgi:F0F1-type ATP synthase delta subunit